MWAWMVWWIEVLVLMLNRLSRLVFAGAKSCPPLPQESSLLRMPAVHLAEAIRSGQVTSRRVVEAYVARMGQVNPSIRAVVDQRFEAALREADEADALLQSTPVHLRSDLAGRKPFLGVPFTVKECLAVQGCTHTAGLVARASVKANHDSDVVRRLKEAGAVPMAVTNVSELCCWVESNNRLFGRTNNPYDLDRTAGGSSGGEAAIVAAAGSPFGIASDAGGSIRIPAAFCGLFGHKPTAQITKVPDDESVLPAAKGARASWRYTLGPICRYAADLGAVLDCMLTPSARAQLQLQKQWDLKHVVLFRWPAAAGLSSVPLDADFMAAIETLLTQLVRRYGIQVQELQLDVNQRQAMAMWKAHSQPESGDELWCRMLTDGHSCISPAMELLKWCLCGRSRHTLPAILLAMYEQNGSAMRPESQAKWLDQASSLSRRLDDLIGQNGVLLVPSFPTTAPLHRLPLLQPLHFIMTGLFNITGQPVTQVPLGPDRNGMPIGVQLVCSTGNDSLGLALAQAVEAVSGGWYPA